MKFAILIVAVAALTQGTQRTTVGYFRTGNQIMKEVSQWERYSKGELPDDQSAPPYFQGYVAGVMDAGARSITTPQGVTLDQACAIVAKFLRDNPQRLHEPAADLIRDALRKAYP